MILNGKTCYKRINEKGDSEWIDQATNEIVYTLSKEKKEKAHKTIQDEQKRNQQVMEANRKAREKEYEARKRSIDLKWQQENKMFQKKQAENASYEEKARELARNRTPQNEPTSHPRSFSREQELQYLAIAKRTLAPIQRLSNEEVHSYDLNRLCYLFSKQRNKDYTLIYCDFRQNDRYERGIFLVEACDQDDFKEILRNKDKKKTKEKWNFINEQMKQEKLFCLGAIQTTIKHEPTPLMQSFQFHSNRLTVCFQKLKELREKRKLYRFNRLQYMGKLPDNIDQFMRENRTARAKIERKLQLPISASFFNQALPEDMQAIIEQYLGYEKEKQLRIS